MSIPWQPINNEAIPELYGSWMTRAQRSQQSNRLGGFQPFAQQGYSPYQQPNYGYSNMGYGQPGFGNAYDPNQQTFDQLMQQSQALFAQLNTAYKQYQNSFKLPNPPQSPSLRLSPKPAPKPVPKPTPKPDTDDTLFQTILKQLMSTLKESDTPSENASLIDHLTAPPALLPISTSIQQKINTFPKSLSQYPSTRLGFFKNNSAYDPGGGNNTIKVKGSKQTLTGGEGNDIILASDVIRSRLNLGLGDNTFHQQGRLVDVTVTGATGQDQFNLSFEDMIGGVYDTGSGDDMVYLQAKQNYKTPASPLPEIKGGSGQDTFVFRVNTNTKAEDIVFTPIGTNRFEVRYAKTNEKFIVDGFETFYIEQNDTPLTADDITPSQLQGSHQVLSTATNPGSVYTATDGDDVLTGSFDISDSKIIQAGFGHDLIKTVLNGGGEIQGEHGDDSIWFTNTANMVTLKGGLGDDFIFVDHQFPGTTPPSTPRLVGFIDGGQDQDTVLFSGKAIDYRITNLDNGNREFLHVATNLKYEVTSSVETVRYLG